MPFHQKDHGGHEHEQECNEDRVQCLQENKDHDSSNERDGISMIQKKDAKKDEKSDTTARENTSVITVEATITGCQTAWTLTRSNTGSCF